MKSLIVPFLPTISPDAANEINKLNYEPWATGAHKPDVYFNIAYNDDSILLKFSVKEKFFKAEYKQTNQPVYKDSCVEFFIGFDENDTYYNFEFNALGTALVAFGSTGDREFLPDSVITNIEVSKSSRVIAGDSLPHEWALNIAIPLATFSRHTNIKLKGITARANFYKCGDDLPEPHFLCWNNITTDQPNFHLPDYFGELIFE